MVRVVLWEVVASAASRDVSVRAIAAVRTAPRATAVSAAAQAIAASAAVPAVAVASAAALQAVAHVVAAVVAV